MLWNATSLRSLKVAATDGDIGKVSDVLFDDVSWTLRWLVVETGSWFSSRKVLLPLSAFGKPDESKHEFMIKLTRQQVRDSPDVDSDLPVSRHHEAHVYNYYGWNPYWTSGFSPMSNAIATPLAMPISRNDVDPRWQDASADAIQDDGDPHLRSVHDLVGYHIAATDGEIGHLEDFLMDDDSWLLLFMLIDTKNWLPGERVLLPVRLIKDIDWFSHLINVEVSRDKVKSSPPYDPRMTANGPFNDQSHQYFGLTLLDDEQLQNLKIGRSFNLAYRRGAVPKEPTHK